MLLTITTTVSPATDLGYLLYKHPGRVQTFPLSFGNAHVFYPEATPERCTAALLLEVDAIALVRAKKGWAGAGAVLEHYINDRPFVASSFMSVALAQVFGTALSGICKERPELSKTAIPLQAQLSVLPSRGGEAVLRKLFEPLGYALAIERHLLDERFPEWGESNYFTLTLNACCVLRDLLAHLYVLIPVLDADKHYWIGEDEVKKLLRHGGDWLAGHPERELIVKRYLKYQRSLTRQAFAQLLDDDQSNPDNLEQEHAREEAEIEAPLSLHQQRLGAVLAVLKECGAQRVLDLGCGEGRLLRVLLENKTFVEIVGIDVSARALQAAAVRLHLDRIPAFQRERVKLWQGALTYRDRRLSGFDAAALVEVIEHLDAPRLSAFEHVIFEFAKPKTVVLTTPNREYNVKWENLPAGAFRHKDHRFEWTRAELEAWARPVARRHGYVVKFLPVGPEDPSVGPPTQMAVFTLLG